MREPLFFPGVKNKYVDVGKMPRTKVVQKTRGELTDLWRRGIPFLDLDKLMRDHKERSPSMVFIAAVRTSWLSLDSGTRIEGNSAKSWKVRLSSGRAQRDVQAWRLPIRTEAETPSSVKNSERKCDVWILHFATTLHRCFLKTWFVLDTIRTNSSRKQHNQLSFLSCKWRQEIHQVTKKQEKNR